MSEPHHHGAGDHSHSHGDHSHGELGHVHPNDTAHFRAYIAIFLALCVFTAISFIFNELVRAGWISAMTSASVIMLVAVVKAGCVAYIFMHLKADWGKVYFIMIPVVIMGVMMIIVLMPDGVLGWR